jgi:3-deoxy-D-manno-octulosonic acid (KDO) 8-phosphate synthase
MQGHGSNFPRVLYAVPDWQPAHLHSTAKDGVHTSDVWSQPCLKRGTQMMRQVTQTSLTIHFTKNQLMNPFQRFNIDIKTPEDC